MNKLATQTEKLKIKLIQPTDKFADETFNAVINDIDEEFVFRTNFTQKSANTTQGYKYRSAKWIPWTFY